MFTSEKDIINAPSAKTGINVITVPDIRWDRRDIKSVALLAQVLAKQAAAEAGAGEAWMIEDGYVTEGGSSSAFILTQDDVIVTRKNSNAILPGCTRKAVVALAEERQLRVEERSFTVEEALAAKEAFITSAAVRAAGGRDRRQEGRRRQARPDGHAAARDLCRVRQGDGGVVLTPLSSASSPARRPNGHRDSSAAIGIRDARDRPRSRGVLDAPPARGMTWTYATDAFTFTGCTARNAIASLFQALMVAISMVRLTVSASENCARTSS